MNSTTDAQTHAREIVALIRAYGVDSIPDYRSMLLDLHGMPMAPEASKALTAAIYHLDGLETACDRLCRIIGVPAA